MDNFYNQKALLSIHNDHLKHKKLTYVCHILLILQKAIIIAFSDADHGNQSDSKDISGYLVKFAGNIVYWRSRKQSYVAAHSTEAELLAVRDCLTFVIYLRNLVSEF